LGDQSVGGETILKWILKTYNVMVRTGLKHLYNSFFRRELFLLEGKSNGEVVNVWKII
jgi:hypothetical protein